MRNGNNKQTLYAAVVSLKCLLKLIQPHLQIDTRWKQLAEERPEEILQEPKNEVEKNDNRKNYDNSRWSVRNLE